MFPPDPTVQRFELGTFITQAGAEIPDAFIAYRTWGSPDLPVILYPTWFSGDIVNDNGWLISENLTLNPEKLFIIVPALFGNSQSSSPSNHKLRKDFPLTTMYDNAKAQHQLLEHLNITKLFAVLGWSMGAAMSYQWAVAYPDMMKHCIPFCGAARTALHNITFLRSLVMALELDPGFKGGDYAMNQQPQGGKAVFSAIYSSWGFSQAFYRQELFKGLGYSSLQAFLDGFWTPLFAHKDALDLRHMLRTWITADITCTPDRPFTHDAKDGRSSQESYIKALESIKTKVLVVPCRTDLYFPPEDSEFEVQHLANGSLYVLESVWGHFAGGPGLNSVDVNDLDGAIARFFAQ